MNEDDVRKWIFKAENDLKIAKDTMCFHAQQCAEKYLKAFLVFHNTPIKRTHDLSILIKNCASISPEFESLYDFGIDELTDYAIDIRYGDEFYFPSVEEAREAVKLAEITRDFVLKAFEKFGVKLDPEKILKEVRDELSQK